MSPATFDYLKGFLPFKNTKRHDPSDNMEEGPLLDPLTPFCCVSAIPSSFRYLAELLPSSTSHNPLTRPHTSGPLITIFLMHITNCYHNPHMPRPREVNCSSASNLYFVIIQLATTTFPFASTSTSTSFPHKLSNNSLRRPSLASSSQLAKSGFTDIPLDSKVVAEDRSVMYFVPIENSRDATVLNPGPWVKTKQWKEISEDEAMESLRFPGTGITIGDGEKWKELEGVERLGCFSHKLGFELRVWVKEL